MKIIKNVFHGFSFYKGAWILFDEDFDTRIYKAIDLIKKQGYLLSDTLFFERKGQLFIYSPYSVYKELHEKTIDIPADGWTIFVEIL